MNDTCLFVDLITNRSTEGNSLGRGHTPIKRFKKLPLQKLTTFNS